MKRLARILPLLLAAALQIMPLVRNIFVNPVAGSTIAFILRWGVGTGAALGAVDAVSGATSMYVTPTSFSGKVGNAFSNNVTISIGGGHNSSANDYFFLSSGSQTSPLLYNGQSTTITLPSGLSFTASWVNGTPSIGGYISGTPTTVGTYPTTVTMVSPGNATLSQNISITIAAADTKPAIAASPVSTNVIAGRKAVFAVSATGLAPLAYQWARDNVPLVDGAGLVGSTSNVLTLASVSTNDAGLYSVTITNSLGSTNANATLTVVSPPVISTQPSGISTNLGCTISFSSGATGSAALVYRWRKNGSAIANGAKYVGVTTPVLTVSNLTVADSGNYSLLVTNLAGSTVSSNAYLDVLSPPAIISQPASLGLAVGNNAQFVVLAGGTTPMTYQWFKDNTILADAGKISGSTSNVLTIAAISTNDIGAYSVVISNALGSATSSNANLAIVLTPVILAQPQPLTLVTGTVAGFSVTADGSGPLAFFWQKNGTNLANGGKYSGVNSDLLAITGVATNDSGNYSVVITNAAGTITSTIAPLTVQLPLSFTLQASNRVVRVGTNTAFSANVAGTAPKFYQWFKNGLPLSDGGRVAGANSNVLTLASVSTNDVGAYSLAVSNAVSAVISSNAMLSVLLPPVITVDVTNQDIAISNAVSFGVVADGTGPLKYQWKKATTKKGKVTIKPIKGATNAVYSIASVGTTDFGGYLVVVANSLGSTTSSVANLNVLLPARFTTQAGSRSVRLGTNTTFSATITGTSPFFCQWLKDGQPLTDGGNISGANSSTLAITGLTTNDSGLYVLVASNLLATVISSNAQLTVLVPPMIIVPPTNQTAVLSNSVSFSVAVDGTAPFRYQWNKGKTIIKGATNATFTLPAVKLTDAATNYFVTIINAAGSITSAPVTLTVVQSAAAVKTVVASSVSVASPPGEIRLVANPDGSMTVYLAGVPGAIYTLESSDHLDVSGWQSIGSAPAQPDGSWQMTDPNAAARPMRFYRVASP